MNGVVLAGISKVQVLTQTATRYGHEIPCLHNAIEMLSGKPGQQQLHVGRIYKVVKLPIFSEL